MSVFAPPKRRLYCLRAQNKVKRVSSVGPGISRGITGLYPSRGYSYGAVLCCDVFVGIAATVDLGAVY